MVPKLPLSFYVAPKEQHVKKIPYLVVFLFRRKKSWKETNHDYLEVVVERIYERFFLLSHNSRRQINTGCSESIVRSLYLHTRENLAHSGDTVRVYSLMRT